MTKRDEDRVFLIEACLGHLDGLQSHQVWLYRFLLNTFFYSLLFPLCKLSRLTRLIDCYVFVEGALQIISKAA